MYTNEDARFDDAQLNGPRCPKHGRGCACCHACGHASGHTSWCRLAEPDDDIVEQQEIGRNLYRRGYSRDMCENSEQDYGWEMESAAQGGVSP